MVRNKKIKRTFILGPLFSNWMEVFQPSLDCSSIGGWAFIQNIYFLMMIMMMMNCFCGLVGRRKACSLISSRDHCQRPSPSRISDTPQARFEPVQNLSSGLTEWSCAVVITTSPRRQFVTIFKCSNLQSHYNFLRVSNLNNLFQRY